MVHSTPSSLSLPSELKHHITNLSSRGSLASLARTHTAFQREAERALYRSLDVVIQHENSLRCIETLARNSEKAALVRFLTVTMECRYNNITTNTSAMTCLLEGLINMQSLSDFRLKKLSYELKACIKGLNEILCEGHFRLKTLYCDDNLDISRIIENQTELQILGIYGNLCTIGKLLKTLKRCQNAQLLLPIVFTLERYNLDHISIFPTFYSVDRSATIHQVLAKSFDKDRCSVDADEVRQLSIYLVDASDIPIIHALAKDLAVSFPKIYMLGFFFERDCRIPSREMKEFLCFFNVIRLDFLLWPGIDGGDGISDRWIPTDVKIAHAKEWADVCPELTVVRFMDGLTLQRESEDSHEWTLWRGSEPISE